MVIPMEIDYIFQKKKKKKKKKKNHDYFILIFFFKKKKNETHINEDKCATPIKLSLITNNDGVTTTTYRH
jgi:hypothetical protein